MKNIILKPAKQFCFALGILIFLSFSLPASSIAQYATFGSVGEKKVNFTSEWDTVTVYGGQRWTLSSIEISTYDRRNPVYIHDVIISFIGGGNRFLFNINYNTAKGPLHVSIPNSSYEEYYISKIAFRYSKVDTLQNKPALVIVNGNRFKKPLSNTLWDYRTQERSAPSSIGGSYDRIH